MDINLLATRQLDRNQHKQMLVENLGIFELRALGRELGVASPTTKKRDDLIELILDKIYNNDTSLVKQTKKGRPFKKLSNLEEIVARMTGSEDNDNLISQRRPLKYEDVVSFAQEVPVYTEVEEEISLLSGVVRKNEVVSYFLDMKEGSRVFIDNKDMIVHGLQEGDLVECEAKKMNSGSDFLLEKVLKVNGVDADKYIPTFGRNLVPVISREKITYGQHELFCGRRNLLRYDGNLFEDDRFADFATYCKENGYKLITLGLNTCFEDQIMFSGIDSMIDMTTVYGTGYDIGFNKVVDTIALAQRLLIQGEKVVLFVNDIVGMLNSLDKCFVEKEMQNGHKEKTVVVAQKLVSLGKAEKGGASITLVMTYWQNNSEDLFFKNELEKISSKFETRE